ncbi:MAG: WYL domain-containing protein [Clostridia bacterium]|nr:WYL domain-containing protein [Clostridia bacterium]
MAYDELIKNFDRIRDYMREFYLYGLKSRNEYTKKSARSYDDERRRVESWLGDYMRFRQTGAGKNVFLSIDSRVTEHNPLYAAWKTKSFTDGDITLHFLLFDILHDPDTSLTLREISEAVDQMLAEFDEPRVFDESTIRKKLKEYMEEGIVIGEKRGKNLYYRRSGNVLSAGTDLLDFFSEAAPCGVIGSFLLDKGTVHETVFAFKHHYITSAMDSEILCSLLCAMQEKAETSLTVIQRRKDRMVEKQVVPLRIRVSVQSGRQYLLAYVPRLEQIASFRLDNILSVRKGEVCRQYDMYRSELEKMIPHLWGISMPATADQVPVHISFTVEYTEREPHIHTRLEREKRCGQVEKISSHSSRFSAEVYDALEMLPWVRTFICRISHFECSDRHVTERLRDDLSAMYRMYDLEGGEEA